MTRYFLHLHECGLVLEDHEGQECASLQHATEIAIANARDVMMGEVRAGRLCLGCYISICDGTAGELLRVPFSDAVAVTGLEPIRLTPRARGA